MSFTVDTENQYLTNINLFRELQKLISTNPSADDVFAFITTAANNGIIKPIRFNDPFTDIYYFDIYGDVKVLFSAKDKTLALIVNYINLLEYTYDDNGILLDIIHRKIGKPLPNTIEERIKYFTELYPMIG